MSYFEWREYSSGVGYLIGPDYRKFGGPAIKGSWGVVPSRILGLSWPEYLRLCRNNGATLLGRDHIYIMPCFKQKNEAFLKMLNDRAAEIDKIIGLKNLNF